MLKEVYQVDKLGKFQIRSISEEKQKLFQKQTKKKKPKSIQVAIRVHRQQDNEPMQEPSPKDVNQLRIHN